MNKKKSNMIESTDLMIGDLINVNGRFLETTIEANSIGGRYVKDVRPCRIIRLGKNNIGFDDFVEENNYIITPIQITSDILITNGFDVIEHNINYNLTPNICDSYVKTYNNQSFRFDYNGNIWQLLITGDNNIELKPKTSISLHTFQHILNICGLHDIAKDIKIKK